MIHSDLNAQSTNDTMMDVSKLSGILRHADETALNHIGEEGMGIPSKKIAIFSNNTNHLLPSHYYSQFKVWYKCISITPSERSDEYNSWIITFKFNFSKP